MASAKTPVEHSKFVKLKVISTVDCNSSSSLVLQVAKVSHQRLKDLQEVNLY
jgi:hypothetical protein